LSEVEVLAREGGGGDEAAARRVQPVRERDRRDQAVEVARVVALRQAASGRHAEHGENVLRAGRGRTTATTSSCSDFGSSLMRSFLIFSSQSSRGFRTACVESPFPPLAVMSTLRLAPRPLMRGSSLRKESRGAARPWMRPGHSPGTGCRADATARHINSIALQEPCIAPSRTEAEGATESCLTGKSQNGSRSVLLFPSRQEGEGRRGGGCPRQDRAQRRANRRRVLRQRVPHFIHILLGASVTSHCPMKWCLRRGRAHGRTAVERSRSARGAFPAAAAV